MHDAILSGIDAQNWPLVALFTEYLVERRDYAPLLPNFLERLPRHIRLDELFIFHSCEGAVLPDSLTKWTLPETSRFRSALTKCFALMAELEPSPMNISALATAAVSLNQESLAVTTLEAMATDIGEVAAFSEP